MSYRFPGPGPGPGPGRRAATLLVPAALVMAALTVSAPVARADNVTISSNNLRTAWDQNESALAPSSVAASDFGQLFSTPVSGQVYAQPIVANGTLFAATENNNVYGMNPSTGAIIWSKNIGAPWPAATLNCGDLVPNIGVTATPVYDSSTGTAYLTAKVNDGVDAAHPHWYMHAFDIKTGVERSGWPVTIAGIPSNSPGNPFNPETASQRPGLLLLGGVVYAGFASHCDHGPYVGYVVGVKTSTAKVSAMWSTEAGSATAEAGIWQSGGGLVSDGPGRIFLATGNGRSSAPGPGTGAPANLAEAVVRLQVNADGSLSTKDYFSPANNTRLDTNDTDFGSGGPMAVPDGFGSTAHPHLLVQSGKDGRVFLLDRDDLGGTAQGPGGTDAVVSQSGPFGGLWGHPAFWGADGGYVYTVENSGYLRASKISLDGSGTPTLSSTGTSAGDFGYTSGSPVVTSSGSASGSALVWAIRSSGSNGTGGQLRAYLAIPQNGVMVLRYSAPIGTAAKFTVPATDNGRVYVGTRDGKVMAFGRPAAAALSGSPVDFGSVAVDSTGRATLKLTATKTVTVTGVSTVAPFGATLPGGSVTLDTGGTLSVPVTFSPTTSGPATAGVTVSTSAGPVAFDLNGFGTQAGFSASPAALAFGTVPSGGVKTLSVSIVNTGTTAATITEVGPPTTPFSAASLPAVGSVIQPGSSLALSVKYSPTVSGSNTGSVSLTADTGTISVPLTGTSVTGSGHLDLAPNPLSFGPVLLGTSAPRVFSLSNSGNLNLIITKAKAPDGSFTTNSPLSEGQVIQPAESIDQPVTFTPAGPGSSTNAYSLTGDDGQGALSEGLTGVGAVVDNFVGAASGRCLDVNNAGTADGTQVQLYDCDATAAQNWRFGAAGSVRALGKCLDVKYAGTADGTPVWLYTCNGTKAQQWSLSATGQLITASSNKCLTPAGSAAVNLTAMVITTCTTGSAAQTWQSAKRTGPVVGSVSGRCLDVTFGSNVNGTAVQLYGCNGTAAQRWSVARGGAITALGKCLDISKSGVANGTPVQIWDCTGGANQQWVLQTSGEFRNPISGRCLTPTASGTANSTKLVIQDCTAGAAQKWVLS